MKKINGFALIVLLTCILASCNSGTTTESKKTATLKEAFADKFYIGTALNSWQITGKDTAGVEVIKNQF
jgi:endo-1,4-beta-xylanase